MLNGSGADSVLLRCLCISPEGFGFAFEGFGLIMLLIYTKKVTWSVL